MVLHDTLGVTIDSTEKSNYHLFPYWHTEEFDRVVTEIIARRDKPRAFSAFNLGDLVKPEAGA